MKIPQSAASKLSRSQLIAISAGNAFEWYDFVVYAYVAAELSGAFFPGNDPGVYLLQTFAIFAVAYFFRPLGGIVFGYLGDRWGRKRILTLIVLLTGVSSAAIGILPGYSQVGILAPILLLALRIVQGIAAGGEYGGAAAYLAESTPAHERGRYISIVPQTSYAGLLAASLLLSGLRAGLGPAAFHAWGWRVPFLIALPTACIALWMRSKLNESTQFQSLRDADALEKNPLLSSLRLDWRSILQVIGLMACLSVGTYVIMVYLQTYLYRVGRLDAVAAQWVMSGVLLTAIIVLPYAGRLSDRLGRRSTMFVSLLLLTIVPVPAFLILSSSNLALSLVTSIILATIFVVYQVASLTAMTEVFDTARRLSGFNVGYNVAIAVFAGPTPYVATLLIELTGIKIAPAYLVAGSAIVSIVTALTFRESAPRVVEGRRRRAIEGQSQTSV
ncbi:MFS transporter [Burkholderia pseudomultivorans]|uniref:MFS transporter n=1 Tax=Burkholderia pseudomultivorans TaxID=1207504 RepID=UPI00287711BE|nr:MFS transporter [Burkholderia pseudomultivorans]MDS0859649.1 MFS transporter [Burkholderia pseudomultivorans]